MGFKRQIIQILREVRGKRNHITEITVGCFTFVIQSLNLTIILRENIVKEPKLRRNTENFSDVNCHILEEVLSGTYVISCLNTLNL